MFTFLRAFRPGLRVFTKVRLFQTRDLFLLLDVSERGRVRLLVASSRLTLSMDDRVVRLIEGHGADIHGVGKKALGMTTN